MRKSLLLVFGVTIAGVFFCAFQKGSSSSVNHPSVTEESASNSLEEAILPATSNVEKKDVSRINLHEEVVAIPQLLEVFVEDESGQPIVNAEVAWHSGEAKTSVEDWSPSKGVGLSMNMPKQAGTMLAQADGYWSNGIAWGLGGKQASTMHIVLTKVVDYQAITCLDSRTKEPVAGIRFRCSATTRKHESAAGEWVSNADGIVRIPRTREFNLAFLSEVPAHTDYASMKYWIYAGTETIEIFHQGLGAISVVDDAGHPLSGIKVGAYAQQRDFSGGASGRFEIAEQVTDEEGLATCLLLLDVEHKVWARDDSLGSFHKQLVPKSKREEIRFQLTPQPPLVLKIELPPGVPEGSLKVEVRKFGKEPWLLSRGNDGLFTLPTPTLNRGIHVSAEGCITISGSLRAPPKGSLEDPHSSSGFVSLRLRHGYEVEGRAVWADGNPAEATLGLFVIDDDRPPYEVVDKQNATGWRWREHHQLMEVSTGPQGEFHFSGLPAATYLLDQVLEDAPHQEGYGVWLAACSFTPAENYLVLPGAENPVMTLPKLQKVSLRVFDSSTRKPLSSFMAQRAFLEDANGFSGSTAEGWQGHFQGWMAVDDLSLLKLTSDGYLPTFLDKAKVNRTAELWEMEIEMQAINPGYMTVYFDVPEGKPDFRARVYMRVIDPEFWSEAFFFKNGVARKIYIPTEGSASVEFAVQSQGYELAETRRDYHAGESFALYLTSKPTQEE